MKTSTLAVGGIGIVSLALAAAVYLRPLEPVEPEPNATPAATQTATPDATTPDLPVEETVEAFEAADPIVDPVEDPVVKEVVVAVEDAPVEVVASAPLVTDFRFEPDGAVLVSGTAPVDLPLALVIDGSEVARVNIGADGSFVMTHFAGFADDARMMTLISDPDGAALASDRRFVLSANPEPVEVAAVEPEVIEDPIAPVDSDPVQVATEEPAVLEVAPDETAVEPVVDPIAPDPEPVQVADDVQTQTAEAEVETETPDLVTETSPSNPAILAVDATGVDVIQPAVEGDASPEVMSTVALDTITYDVEGDVILSGRALNDGFVQVYVNNTPVSRLPVAPDGTWRTDLPDVDTGVYTLRIDEVDEGGEVVSRIETPFLREDPADVVEAMADDVADPEFTIATRTVQPGATLWAIAEERYGSGVLYVTVFEANRDRIRDPDLIYPGQVFMMPEDSN